MLPLIDLVAEIIDARIPLSSRNPELSDWVKSKPRIVLLNKCDMADEQQTIAWVLALNDDTTLAIPIDCKSGRGFDKFLPAVKRILAPRLEQLKAKGMGGRTLRIMAVGIPNVGKSSFINRLSGNSRAKVENRPGVTRGNQWFMIDKGVELLDTPGVLWPKFETLGCDLAVCLKAKYPELLCARYKLDCDIADLQGYEILELIAQKRGMKISGGDPDYERAASTLLEEFRNCKIGRMTLEKAGDEL